MRRGLQRRGLILAAVLLMIGLLALTMAGYVFFVRAEIAGIRATGDAQQARLTAESGLEELIALLRIAPQDRSVWFDNPQRLRHALVWAEGYDRESDPIREARSRRDFLAGQNPRVPAWRYSVVAPRLDGPEGTVRFGVTPESSKLNLNVATEQQLNDLLLPLLVELGVENPGQLVAALLDWRDEDSDTREGGAENGYYNTLEPPYYAKNGPLDTIEELLLVKGFNAAVLYGEDLNRNGILDRNENDGDASPPLYDNGDGVLNHGIAPFVTVWSLDADRASDHKPRINLNDDPARITEQIERYFAEGQISESTLTAVLALKSSGQDFSQYPTAASLFVVGGGEEAAEPGADEDAPQTPAGGRTPETNDPNAAGSSADKRPGLAQDRRPRGGTAQRPPRIGGQPGTADGGPGGRTGGGRPRQTIAVPAEELPILLDYFSTRSGDARFAVRGLINVNTAPSRVLAVIPGLPPSAVPAILELRERLGPDKLRSIGWLRSEGVLSQQQFEAVAPYITASAYQFTVEIFAYADHTNATTRLEWVIDLVGLLPQVLYHRDLTRLGPGWPVDSETVIVSR